MSVELHRLERRFDQISTAQVLFKLVSMFGLEVLVKLDIQPTLPRSAIACVDVG